MLTPNCKEDAGFTLIELLMAMAITLLVSGAIFGLLSSGQSAFRREPELVERQQNIRIAMDLIMKDIANAGAGLQPFVQVFTPGLNACTACPVGAGGAATDDLEIVTNDSAGDNLPACQTNGTGVGPFVRLLPGTAAFTAPLPVVLSFVDGTWTLRNVTSVTSDAIGGGLCPAGSIHPLLAFDTGADTSGMNVAGDLCSANALGYGNATAANCTVAAVSPAEIVRYRIRPESAAAGAPLVLERSSSRSFAAGFQTVARDIDDLQVQYTQANGTTTAAAPGAPAVVLGDYATLTTRVQVTLSSRTATDRALGARSRIVRGQLVSAGSPRSTLVHLANEPKPYPTGRPDVTWR